MMATNNIVAHMAKEDKLNDQNYKIWHKRMMGILNQHELLDTINAPMAKPEAGNTVAHRREHKAYHEFLKRDCSACYTLLSYMHDDMMGMYEQYTST